jgi:signal transduction histidine kinase
LNDAIRTHANGTAVAADPLQVRANKLELLERLADALAHEIKNPLHSMVINLEVLKRRLARTPDEGGDVLRYATVLGEELERVSQRIELLLRLSRPERGEPEETTLTELLDEVMELVNLEARHREARVEYQRGAQMVRVRLGRQAARQIILNLVLDALHRCAGGGRARGADGVRRRPRGRRRAPGGGRRAGRGRGRPRGRRRCRAYPGAPRRRRALKRRNLLFRQRVDRVVR